MRHARLMFAMTIAGLLLTAGPSRAQSSDDRGPRGGERGGGGGSPAGPKSTSGGGESSSGNGSTGGSTSPVSSPSDPFIKPYEPPRPSIEPSSSPKAVKVRATERDRKDRDGGPRRAESTNTSSTHDTTRTSGLPTGTRPQGDHPATGTAVPRVGPRPPRDSEERKNHHPPRSVPSDVYPPTHYPPAGPPYLYDPWLFYWVFGPGVGFPPEIWLDAPHIPPAPDQIPAPDVIGRDQGEGALKLRVKPRTAKVYVDGYFVGLVDDFDGAFQKLRLTGGRHRIELRAEGYETAVVEMLITRDKTVTFAGDMKRIQ